MMLTFTLTFGLALKLLFCALFGLAFWRLYSDQRHAEFLWSLYRFRRSMERSLESLKRFGVAVEEVKKHVSRFVVSRELAADQSLPVDDLLESANVSDAWTAYREQLEADMIWGDRASPPQGWFDGDRLRPFPTHPAAGDPWPMDAVMPRHQIGDKIVNPAHLRAITTGAA